MKYMKSLKEQLKSIKFIYSTNATLKNLTFKWLQNNQLEFFKKAFEKHSYIYDEQKEITHFKQRLFEKGFTYKERMTVLWIGTDENQDKSGFLQGLRKICNVIEFVGPHGKYGQEFPKVEFDPEIQKRNGQRLLEFYQEISQTQKIDFIMGQILFCYIHKNILKKFSNIPIINISMDDRLPHLWKKRNGYELGAAGLGDSVDLTLTTCSDMCPRYSFLGMPSLFWPLASDPEVFFPKQHKDIEISFIGNKYGVREKIISELLLSGIKIEAYGTGWPNGRINHNEAPDIFNRSKIILGIGTVAYCEDVYTLKLRDFDAVMAGALYITHRNPDLEKIFHEGNEIEFYTDTKELVLKLKRIISDQERIESIGKRAREKAINCHTWDIRFSELLKLMQT